MKALITFIALFFASNLYAGWTAGGGSGMILGSEGEIITVQPDDPKENLLEAALKGPIIVRDSEGEKKLIPANYDFHKKTFTMREAKTGKLLLLRELQVEAKAIEAPQESE